MHQQHTRTEALGIRRLLAGGAACLGSGRHFTASMGNSTALLFVFLVAAGYQYPAHVLLVAQIVPLGPVVDPAERERSRSLLAEKLIRELASVGLQEIPQEKGGGYAVDTRLAQDNLCEDKLARLAIVPNVRVFSCDGLLPETWSRLGQLSDLEVLIASGTSFTDDHLQCLRDLSQLRELVLQGYGRQLHPFGDRSIMAVAHMHRLHRLVLHSSGITDGGLAYVGGLSRLESLEITGTFGDSGVRNLQNLESLRVLVLKGEFTDDGLKHLVGLKNLESLVLESDFLTGAGLAHLAGLQQLKLVKFRGSPTGPKTLAPLLDLPALESLNLAYPTTDDAILTTLGQMRKLKSLTVRNASISDDGIVTIEGLHGLQELDLQNTGITDRGLQHILPLRHLRVLVLGSVGEGRLVTRNGLRTVAHLPRLEELDILRVDLQEGALDELVSAKSLRRLNFNMRRELQAGWARLEELRPEIEKTQEFINVKASHPDLPWFGNVDVLRR